MFLAYVTSYLYVGVVWTNHKAAFRRIRTIDGGLHWANLGILFTTALLPFPTAVIADAVQGGNATDVRTAVALYALVGVLLCVSWLAFFHYLARHPDLLEEDVAEDLFPRERKRALAGIVLYIGACVVGSFMAPPFALGIFLLLAIFYGVTSEGLHVLPEGLHVLRGLVGRH